jgi:hypothetical protein
VVIGESLQPVFSGHPLWRKGLLMHLVADENWAVTRIALTFSGAFRKEALHRVQALHGAEKGTP